MTKKKLSKESVARTSATPLEERIEDLKALFPDAFSEGKVDFEKLRQVLGNIVDDRPERYSFTWAGKRDAIRLLQIPSRATLIPAPRESVNFDTTQNLFIEGENLEVLKLLYKSYAGQVKMIYIDPPYNTGNDFIYPDDFTDPLDTYLRLTGQKDNNGNFLTSNPETSGRYHSTWLSMMYSRLFIARQLLSHDGMIFVSIDDHEVSNLRLLMNEVFGEENFVSQVEWQKRYTRSNNTDDFTSVIDHILLYQKGSAFKPNLFERQEEVDARYSNPDNDPRGPWKSIPFLNPLSPKERPNLCYKITNPNTGEQIIPTRKAWRSEKTVYERYFEEKRLWWGKDGKSSVPSVKRFLSEVRQGMTPINFWDHEFAGHTDQANAEIKELFGDKVFDTPKPTLLLRRMIQIATESDCGNIVLDFFAGSCPTAQAVLEQNRIDGGNRRFIMVQLPEPTPTTSPAHSAGYSSIAEIGKERIRRAIAKMKKERSGQLELKDRLTPEDLGFNVFKLAPSSYRQWHGVEEKDPKKYTATMELFTDPLLEGWKPRNVIHEVALKEGYALTCQIEELKSPKDNQVYRVIDSEKDQSFLICLDQKLRATALKALNLGKEDIFICRDVALTDELAANLALQCRLKTI